jgi:hypothetical protein
MIDTGRVSSTVADERGEYRLRGLPAGRYKVQAELSGFSTIIIPDIELLVGQNRSVPFQMQVASLSETLTVTAESPLVDISSTQVAGNVDRRDGRTVAAAATGWSWPCRSGHYRQRRGYHPGVRDRRSSSISTARDHQRSARAGASSAVKPSRESAVSTRSTSPRPFARHPGAAIRVRDQQLRRSVAVLPQRRLNAKIMPAAPRSNQQSAAPWRSSQDKAHFFPPSSARTSQHH